MKKVKKKNKSKIRVRQRQHYNKNIDIIRDKRPPYYIENSQEMKVTTGYQVTIGRIIRKLLKQKGLRS